MFVRLSFVCRSLLKIAFDLLLLSHFNNLLGKLENFFRGRFNFVVIFRHSFIHPF